MWCPCLTLHNHVPIGYVNSLQLSSTGLYTSMHFYFAFFAGMMSVMERCFTNHERSRRSSICCSRCARKRAATCW